MHNLHIIIPTIRKEFIGRIMEQIYDAEPHGLEIRVHLMFQSDKRFHLSRAFEKVNEATDMIQDGWLWTLSDDAPIEKNVFRRLTEVIRENPSKQCIVFSSEHFIPERKILHASADNMEATKVGGNQYIMKRELIGTARHDYLNYGDAADGEFLHRIYHLNKDKFLFVDEVLSKFNYYFWKDSQ